MAQYVTLDSRLAKPRREHAIPRAVTLAVWEAEMRAAELGALADIPARVIGSLDPGTCVDRVKPQSPCSVISARISQPVNVVGAHLLKYVASISKIMPCWRMPPPCTPPRRPSGRRVTAAWSPMVSRPSSMTQAALSPTLAMRPVGPGREVFELGAVAHGPEAEKAAERLVAEIQAWDRDHR
jgi:hypothetical protein